MLTLRSIRPFKSHHYWHFDFAIQSLELVFHSYVKRRRREGKRLILRPVNRVQCIALWIVTVPVGTGISGSGTRCYAEVEPSCRRFVGRFSSWNALFATR